MTLLRRIASAVVHLVVHVWPLVRTAVLLLTTPTDEVGPVPRSRAHLVPGSSQEPPPTKAKACSRARRQPKRTNIHHRVRSNTP